jgi:hypothetical protein
VAYGFIRNFDRNVKPGARGPMLYQVESLVHSVDGSDEKVRSSFGQLLGGREHEFCDAGPVIRVDAVFVLDERMSVHRDFGMIVGTEQVGALGADSAIAKRGSFRAGCDDANV